MNNEYIFTPTLDIDVSAINEIALRRAFSPEDGLASHQRSVYSEPYLVSVREKYPFLSEVYNIYVTAAGSEVPIHICGKRGCGLNFPIQYMEDSHTIFYKFKNPVNEKLLGMAGHLGIVDEERVYTTFNPNDVEEVFRYTLSQPTLMNTRIPHSVITGPAQQRIILSWSVTVSYNLAKQLLGG